MPESSRQVPLVALTGSTGFIGSYLSRELPKDGYQVRVLLRRPSVAPLDCASAVIGDLSRLQNMRDAFNGVHAVIHTAGLAHAMSGIPEDDYRALNTDATISLARAAFACGVKRFIFLSSVRAQAGPSANRVLSEADEADPRDAYGRSKLSAERGLSQLDGDWTALRLTLTYGPGARGNFARLHRLALSPYPLPFGAINARRSMLSLDNLLSALKTVLNVGQPLQRALLVADPQALGLSDIISIVRKAAGRRPNLISVSPALLRLAFTAVGHEEEFRRIAEPLEVSTAALRSLGWKPAKRTEEALADLTVSATAARP